MKNRVLFIDSVHPVLNERLTALGYDCEEVLKTSKSEIEKNLSSVVGIVIRSRFTIDSIFLDAATDLRFIARSGAGMENIDEEYAKTKNVLCLNAPEGNRSAVAEHVIGSILSLFNRIHLSDRDVRQNLWERERNRGIEIEHKTFGIIGYGNTGSTLAKKLSGFGCNILVYDKYKGDIDDEWVQEVSLEELQERAQVISLHVPLTEETKFMIDDSFIEKCKQQFYLVNTSRGQVLKTQSLVQGIKNEKILGACLDVLEYERKSFESFNTADIPEALTYLYNSDKVILTPHVAGWTHESYFKLSNVLADKIEKHFGKLD